MPTNDEIFEQLNLTDKQQEFVTRNEAQYNKKGFNQYSKDPKAQNLLEAIDGVSTQISSDLSHTVSERDSSRKDYGNDDSGRVTVMDLASKGLSGRTLDHQVVEADVSSGSTISGQSGGKMFLENSDIIRPKGSVAAQVAGEKRFGQFSIQGTSKQGNEYSFEAYGKPGAYQYRALHGDDHGYYPLSDEQYGNWSDRMKEKTKRMGELESDPYASEIRKAWTGEAGTATVDPEKTQHHGQVAPSKGVNTAMNKMNKLP